MSILVALLLAQAGANAAQLPPPSAAVAENITVIGSRLDDWKGGVYKRDGKLTCRIEESSGDTEIDMIRCGAMIRCFTPMTETMDAVAQADLPTRERNRQLSHLAQSAQPCLDAAHKIGVRMLAEKRVAE